MKTHRPVHLRFFDKVAHDPETGCWEWTASRLKGYGRFNAGTDRSRLAHRYSYELLVGPIPAGLTLDHLCRNTGCVNPDHLEVVTSGENTLRGTSFSAVNAGKTSCVRGHELVGDNVRHVERVDGRQERVCRRCERLRRDEWKRRNPEKRREQWRRWNERQKAAAA